eukprot:TRINITY_DN1815_c1_g1_i1.p1 TRINITY_DN1815_c1_g1~~TRINITY_DN1815_c1_g1_i1.p1  ORF type:complete len:461 (+),score=104.74 TRINITY_DN1815_c1_g1_i1:164-1546(+)
MRRAELIHKGTLRKQGGKIKTWKRRWCVLDTTQLTYYKSEGGEHMGEIPVSSFGSIIPGDKKSKEGKEFKLATPGREYVFVAEDENDMKAWIEALNKAKQAGGGGASGVSGGGNRPRTAAAAEEVRYTEEDFEKLRVVGQGSFGKVLQVRNRRTGAILAMKVLKKKRVVEKNEFKAINTEKNILMKLSHPFLIQLHASFQNADRLFFVMDFVRGGELFFHMQNDRVFDPERARFYTAEIVLGLTYLHSMGVIYRDLKPENILITADGHVCLTDFGISKDGLDCSNARTATFCGTPEYLAPEVLLGHKYGREIDYWSLGTILYEMLLGAPPFYNEDVQEMYRNIMTASPDLSEVNDAPTKDIVAGFLERDPANRICDVRQIKAHPYFASIDWAKLERKELEPPFIPQVKNSTDTQNFSDDFTSQPLNSLPTNSYCELSATVQDQFKDFSYTSSKLAELQQL